MVNENLMRNLEMRVFTHSGELFKQIRVLSGLSLKEAGYKMGYQKPLFIFLEALEAGYLKPTPGILAGYIDVFKLEYRRVRRILDKIYNNNQIRIFL